MTWGTSRPPTEGRRPKRYACLCSTCLEDFGSVFAFDFHRVGVHAYVFSATDPDRLDGRRCLSPDEMEDKGMHKDQRGRWRTADRGYVSRLDVAA